MSNNFWNNDQHSIAQFLKSLCHFYGKDTTIEYKNTSLYLKYIDKNKLLWINKLCINSAGKKRTFLCSLFKKNPV